MPMLLWGHSCALEFSPLFSYYFSIQSFKNIHIQVLHRLAVEISKSRDFFLGGGNMKLHAMSDSSVIHPKRIAE